MTEADLMREIQKEASYLGHRLFRNSVGKALTKDGRFISFGLCVGSSDLIGFTRNGLFLAVETKIGYAKPTEEQQTFIEVVNRNGGLAGVCYSLDDFRRLVNA